MTSEEPSSNFFIVVTCSPILIVYCDIISGHTHKELSCTKLLPRVITVK